MATLFKRGGGDGGKAKATFTYSGSYDEYDDDLYHYVRMLTSGVFTIQYRNPAIAIAKVVDVFLVGGGGGGSYYFSNQIADGAGGGGGYTKTYSDIDIQPNIGVSVTIGAGGERGYSGAGNGGGFSEFFTSAYRAPGGLGGARSNARYLTGGAGGSGGGAGTGSTNTAGNGGSNGSNGGASSDNGGYDNQRPGNGQGTTTRAFGETTGDLYAGGGGGGGGTGGGAGGSGGGGGRGVAGTPNTGGGGGFAANGGSGIVIVRWLK